MIKKHLATSIIFFIFIIHLLIGIFYQFIDGDEGGYLTLSWLTLQGQIPHLDFFAPQMPLFFYVYGLFIKIFGHSFEAGRLLSALFCIAGFIFFALTIYEFFRNENELLQKRAVFVASVLFSTNMNLFVQGVQVKHYAPAINLMIVAFYFLFVWRRHFISKSPLQVYFLLTALAVLFTAANMRSFMVLTLPIVLLWVIFIFWQNKKFLDFKSISFVLLGCAIPSLPTLYIISRSWSHFDYNIQKAMLAYFGKLSQMSWNYKIYLFKLMNWQQPQYLILSILAILTFLIMTYQILSKKNLFVSIKSADKLSMIALYFFSGVAIAGTYLWKSPIFSYIQWNYVNPFYIFFASLGLGLYMLSTPLLRKVAYSLLVLYAGFFLLEGLFPEKKVDLPKYGNHDIHLRDQSPWAYWLYNHRDYNQGTSYRSLSAVYKVAAYLEKNVTENAVILSWLNGPLFIAKRYPVKGFEEGVGMNEIFWPAQGPTFEESQKFHILTKQQLKEKLLRKEISYVILDPYSEEDIREIVKKEYQFKEQITQYEIYSL